MKRRLAAWLRPHLLAGVEAELTRLRRELEAQRAAVAELEKLRQVSAGSPAEAGRSPEELEAALRPLLEAMLGQRAKALRRRRWRSAGAAIALTAASTAAVWWWRSGPPLVPPAAARASRVIEPAAVIDPQAPAEAPPPVAPATLEESSDGFGLGQAARSDRDLAAVVRERLSRCAELAGARVHFSVREGWIWLRGAASESGRRAAEHALLDLGEGVLVVNQIEAAPDAVVAER